MPEFNAPLRDMRFVLHEVFEAPALWARLPALADHVDADTADAILEEAAKVTGQLIAPLNRSGDVLAAPTRNDGTSSTPPWRGVSTMPYSATLLALPLAMRSCRPLLRSPRMKSACNGA